MKLRHHAGPAPRDRRRSERGVTLLEVAFALPVFILFLFGLVDGGGAVLQSSQASSAAADGARAASVLSDLTGAETSGPAHDKIVGAVKARLVGQAAENPQITITCDPAPCGSEGDDRDQAQIEVEVSWTWKPVTYVGHGMGIDKVTGSATMGLVVIPTGYNNTATTTPAP